MEHSHWYYCFLDVASVVRWIMPAAISIGFWELLKDEIKPKNSSDSHFWILLALGAAYVGVILNMEPGHFWLTP